MEPWQEAGYPSAQAFHESLGLSVPEGVVLTPGQIVSALPMPVPTSVTPWTGPVHPPEVQVMQAGFGLDGVMGGVIDWLGGTLTGLLGGGLVGGAVGGAVTGLGGALNQEGGAPVQAAQTLPLVGPGVAEPPAAMVKNRWETRVYDNSLGYIKLNFYALTDGRIAMYHNYRKYWKVWRPKKNLVLSMNPRLRDLKKLDRVYNRMQKAVKKFAPKDRRTSRQAPSSYLSSVERKALGN